MTVVVAGMGKQGSRRHAGLRIRHRLLNWYRPIDFSIGRRGEPVTMERLDAIYRSRFHGDQQRLRTAEAAMEEPTQPIVDAVSLRAAGLRFSILFPDRLLHRRGDGRSVLVDAETAIELLHAQESLRTSGQE